jgi:hypothetical protein
MKNIYNLHSPVKHESLFHKMYLQVFLRFGFRIQMYPPPQTHTHKHTHTHKINLVNYGINK